ncbi:MAG: TRAP transporter substrate-binding protein, partial [Bradyrhizobium guangdongense]
AVARTRFDEFLKQSPAAAATIKTDADRETLFKQFQAWDAEKARAEKR